ncbi:hypothetical protein CDAR_250231 [Caerostris darwini]|uniref:Uncharacterized protein n=1 Tax=Caerostris darwini TaxID=1538125 RepID=A0AAV4QFZ4_9ARAC|nr:hypothetical protein CDAR_250231 [Caerostris darwini]
MVNSPRNGTRQFTLLIGAPSTDVSNYTRIEFIGGTKELNFISVSSDDDILRAAISRKGNFNPTFFISRCGSGRVGVGRGYGASFLPSPSPHRRRY